MSGLVASTRAELLRLRHWPAVWVLAGAWLLLNLLFVYGFSYVSYVTGDAAGPVEQATAAQLLAGIMPDGVPTGILSGTPMFGGALVMIVGALAVGSGYGWGTWKTVLTTGPGRVATFGGTLVALAVVVVGVVVVTAGVDLGVANVLAAVEGQPLGLPPLADLGQAVGAALLVLGMWTAAGVVVGVLAKGPALAVGLGLVWSLVLENLLRGVSALIDGLDVVTNHLPGSAVGSVVGAVTGGGGAGEGTPGVLTVLSAGPAVTTSVVYLVAFTAIALVLVRVRDLT